MIKYGWKYKVYSQSTLTEIMWLAELPIPLSAVQRYCPVKFLLMFSVLHGLPTNGSMMLVPSSSTLVQVMFGVGLPVALQNKARSEPSLTVCLPLDEVILGGAERKEIWLTINGFGLVSLSQWQTSSLLSSQYSWQHKYTWDMRILTEYQLHRHGIFFRSYSKYSSSSFVLSNLPNYI